MLWQPSGAGTTDTSLLYKAIEKVGQSLDAIEVIRKAGKDPLQTLGSVTIDHKDKDVNPRTITDFVADQCKQDAESCGGEQRYEIKAYVKKRSNKGVTEEIVILGNLKFGVSEGGGKEVAGTLREVTSVIKSMGDAQEKAADAGAKNMDTLHRGFELMAAMNQTLADASEKHTAVTANTVKLLEIQKNSEKEERQERREDNEKAAARAAEAENDRRVFGFIGMIGAAVRPHVPNLLNAFAFAMVANAAAKAKAAGVDVSTPDMQTPTGATGEPAEPGNVTIVQESAMGHELLALVERLGAPGQAHLKKTLGEDIWSILTSAMAADTDDVCMGCLRKFAAEASKLTPKKKNDIKIVLAASPNDVQIGLLSIFMRAGVDLNTVL